MSILRLSGIVNDSIVDGPGIRLVVFAQGCPHGCPGCHNPDTHNPAGGYDASIDDIIAKIQKNPLLMGVTFSGGEPFAQSGAFAELAARIRELGLNILTYTGYTIEELLAGIHQRPDWRLLLERSDTLVDGRYIEAERDLLLRFRGSRNQRIIDPAASLAAGCAVEKNF